MTLKPLAVTMGDPAGIGIEIAAKAWLERQSLNLPPFCLIGDTSLIQTQVTSLFEDVPISRISSTREVHRSFSSALPVLDPDIEGGEAAQTIAAIDLATELCLSGETAAIITTPIQKKRLYDAGFSHPGHTEYLAELTGSPGKAVMMLACHELKVVPATIHIPLASVADILTEETLEHVIRTTDQDLKTRFGIAKPRIAVAGLNPHAGEEGSMGSEELQMIAPLVRRLQVEGVDLKGPLSADTLFHKAARAGYDAAVCMYHDQALIPIKTIDFDKGVNVTLGLPIIRTSPDHGTADDIAGKGIARPSSLIAAIEMAAEMAQHREHSAS